MTEMQGWTILCDRADAFTSCVVHEVHKIFRTDEALIADEQVAALKEVFKCLQAGRYNFNLDHLRWENPPLNWEHFLLEA